MISIHSSDLVRALRRVVPVLPSRGGIPIHSCVRIQAADGGVLFAATDGIRAVQTVVDGEASGGMLAVPGAMLSKIASTLPVGEVTLAPGKGHVEVRAGKARFRIPAYDSGDLAPLHEQSGDPFLAVSARKFGDALAAVRHAVSDDDSRPHLSGVLVELDALNIMRVVATDGHRLVIHTSAVDGGERARSLFVPGLALPMLVALCGEHIEHVVEVRRQAGYVLATAAATTVAVREIEAQFPPYAKIIPSDDARGTHAGVDRKDLADAVARVAVVVTGTSGVRLEIGANSVSLSAAGPDVGEASDDVAAGVSGKPRKVGLNAGYVLDALRSSTSERATVSVNGELDPVVIETVDTLSVIMPMRA